MKTIFFGTPDFARTVLRKISESPHEILAVVTAPDKERGRGRKVTYTAVKEFALEKGIPILQPENLKDPEFIKALKNFDAEVFVVVAFRILPEIIYTMPPKGAFNLHASLLPKYRGAAPIQWALIKGEKETGVTTFFLEKKVDTGKLILQKKLPIAEDDDFGTLHDKLSILGAEVTLETLDLIEKGNLKLIPQDDSLACPAPKITKDIRRIEWNKNAIEVHNLVRGLSPYPAAFFEHRGRIYKIFKTKTVDRPTINPGEFYQTKKELFVGCADKPLQILEIQPEGRKRMTAEEFLRGYSLTD